MKQGVLFTIFMVFSGYVSATSDNGALKRLKEKAEIIVAQYKGLPENVDSEKAYRDQWWPGKGPNKEFHELRSQLTQELADIVQIIIDEKLLEDKEQLQELKDIRQAIVEISQMEPRRWFRATS